MPTAATHAAHGCQHAFEPDLAESLSNLSVRLAEVGRPEDTLPVVQEGSESTQRWRWPILVATVQT